MKHEETLKKAIWTFQDDEDDALLKLAILKERADYRKFFTIERRKAVGVAYSKIAEETAKGPGYDPDKRTSDTLADFRGELLHRFGIHDPLPIRHNHPPLDQALDLLDPRVDAREIPEAVRRSVLRRLFYTPGVREVIPASVQARRGRGEAPWRTTSPDCEPYERLYKINLRKKPAQLLRELKATLASVDAHRGMDPAAYTAWKQDRTRKREEAWDHLQVWRMRRDRKGFIEIARALKIKTSTAKMRFFRAHELIEGHPYDSDLYKLENWNLRECKTCSDNPINGGTCKGLCPDMEERAGSGKASSRGLKTEQIQDLNTHDEWLISEAREIQTEED